MERREAVIGIGTALPPHAVTREDLEALLAPALGGGPEAERRVRALVRRSRVEVRHSCLPDFAAGASSSLRRRDGPGTAARMDLYRAHAPSLAIRACERALRASGADPREVTHLVVVSSTGHASPGLDAVLIDPLGLPRDVKRTVVGFMGCEGVFAALRIARSACAERPDARVLIACVELCSIHLRVDAEPSSLFAATLFGDGASAMVIAKADVVPEALLYLGADDRRSAEPSLDRAGWEIGDDGIRFSLPASPPKLPQAELRAFLAALGSTPDGAQLEALCVQPAESWLLDAVTDALGLTATTTASSREVMRRVGSVVSATLGFVLEREIERTEPGATGSILGHRPGAAMEGWLFERGSARPVG
ncbi:alkylresorcinol/alkylpyrone synthase [Burkholderiales bacterium]|nr:alkylresorcinol/alkylpyrone synthase [Burkholderiales bacterium]